ncbi:MAG: AMP-binding protein [Sneathiellaceae bacterium]
MHVTDMFYLGARHHPERLAFTGEGGDFTYDAARRMANRIAHAARAKGIGIGSRFAVLSPNCGPAMIAQIGAMRAGAAWCNLNLRNTLEGNVDILARGHVDVLFYHSSVSEQLPSFKAGVSSLSHTVCLDAEDANGPSLAQWCADQPDSDPGFTIPVDAFGMQGATGGTTGQPKLTQSDNHWLFMSNMGWAICLHHTAPPVNLAVTPITHAGGMVAMAQWAHGGTSVMMAQVDLEKILQTIQSHRVTTIFLPPTVIYMLLAHPKLKAYDTSSLEYLISAAAPLAPEKIAEAVGALGPVVCQAFGQTEAGFPLTFMSTHETAEAVADPAKRHRLLSCGRQTPVVEAMEVMDEEGRILGPDEVGEIVLRAPSTMKEYLDDPAATAEIKKFGWLHTGDIGYRDGDGYWYITDRKRDMIVSGGFNIFPFEIESVLMSHPAVQDCAVVGVPDEKWGEAVKAVVQLAPGKSADRDELIALCREKLGGMKTPKSIDVWDDLPRSPVGKVLKREIRKAFWEGKGRSVG